MCPQELVDHRGHGVAETEDRRGGNEDDDGEKCELGGDARPFALRVALAHEAEGAEAQRMIRCKQPTSRGSTA